MLDNATVKNLRVSGKVTGVNYVGGIAGYIYRGNIINCINSVEVDGEEYVGGIVGRSDNSTIQKCINNGSVLSYGDYVSYQYLGGIVGYARYGTIEDCTNSGSVIGISEFSLNQLESYGSSSVGGIAGYGQGCDITNCTNSAEVRGVQHVGGIVGSYVECGIINCNNSNSVRGIVYLGGIVGDGSRSTIANCTNSIDLDGMAAYVGGIVGRSADDIIEKCINNGSLEMSKNVGGIVGIGIRTLIKNCMNSGSMVATNSIVSSVGGVIGCSQNSVVENYMNSGSISGSNKDTGGIIGYNELSQGEESGGSIINCYYLTGTANDGAGVNEEGIVDATSKTEEEYSSGEVTYLLQGKQEELIWGQKLGEEAYPVLTVEESKKVCKVTFLGDDGGEHAVCYANYNGKVTALPAAPQSSSGEPFRYWETEDGGQFTTNTVVTGDLTLTPVYGAAKDVVSVDITWGVMDFVYYEGAWDTESHTWGEGAWEASVENGGQVTVENNSTIPVEVQYKFEKDAEAYENGLASVTGSFTTADADGDGSSRNSVLQGGGDTETVSFLLKGKPEKNIGPGTKIGSLTITIAETEE